MVETINIRRLYQAIWGPDLPWVPIDISIASVKVRNGDDFLDFP